MAWIESNQELGRHPKTKKLARLLDEKVPAVIGYLHLLWWWALDFAQDGNLSEYDEIDIAEACLYDSDEKQFVDALIQARFLDQTANGLVIHDWHDYAGKLIEKRQEDAERKRKARARKSLEDSKRTSNGCPADVQEISEDVQRNSTVHYSTVPSINNTDDDLTRTCEEESVQTFESDTQESIGTKAIQFAQKAWGRPVSPLDCESIGQWCQEFKIRGSTEPDEIVIEALRRSSDQNIRTMKYVSAILRDWLDNGVLEVSQILDLDEKFQKSKKITNKASPSKHRKTGTDSGKYDKIYL